MICGSLATRIATGFLMACCGAHLRVPGLKTENFSKKIGRFSERPIWIYSPCFSRSFLPKAWFYWNVWSRGGGLSALRTRVPELFSSPSFLVPKNNSKTTSVMQSPGFMVPTGLMQDQTSREHRQTQWLPEYIRGDQGVSSDWKRLVNDSLERTKQQRSPKSFPPTWSLILCNCNPAGRLQERWGALGRKPQRVRQGVFFWPPGSECPRGCSKEHSCEWSVDSPR